MTKNREIYTKGFKSGVWHFRKECRYWPESQSAIHSIDKPKHGTLCDYCQSIERKERKELK